MPSSGSNLSLFRRVLDLSERENLFPVRSLVLVLVSGGPDSLALLHLLCGLGAAGPSGLHALHVNHELRGAASDADEALVTEHCRLLGIPLHIRHAPLSKEEGNIQERARDERRRAALEAAETIGAERIATGHTLDDQVETLLYRLGRYGGLRAFRGMLVREDPWVRPLLTSRRQETEAFCRQRGIVYAVDSGNVDPGYIRTHLRQRVLPVWEEVLPGAVRAAGRAAEVGTELVALVDELLEEAERQVSSGALAGGDDWECGDISAGRLLRLPSALRRALFHRLLERLPGVTASRELVFELDRLVTHRGHGALDLGAGWQGQKDYDRLRLIRRTASTHCGSGSGENAVSPGGKSAAGDERELPIPGRVEWGGLLISAEPTEGFRAHDPRWEVYLDRRAVTEPLTVRSAKPGDEIRPLGAPGRRKVQDLLVDLRVPAPLRSRVPLVLAGSRVLWVGGFAVAEEGRIRQDTRDTLRIVITKTEDPHD